MVKKDAKQTSEETAPFTEEPANNENKKKTQDKDSNDDEKEEPTKGGFRFRPRKNLIPFVLWVALFVGVHWYVNVCNIKAKKRKDCGYPGISTQDCLTIGKFKVVKGGTAEFFTYFGGYGGIALVLWFISGYEAQSLVLYMLMSALLGYHHTGCCYDDKVDAGVPHCYTSK
eukprot:gnl/MRDRNA2_/MRDRNA2_28067_c0_seq1.p1 gnl/MRDRNA2_/MRDRNA2_28067_c0~~gnl/MRDRNA2_/MRDRNA2_28067_c0_seq1.p1  ORF type:complete len:171 (+),score=32.33 gnl/MRDRNA2_/MRDRNA2_28067_c0_seq1:116-628(+)